MKTLLINGFGKSDSEGITLNFNEKTDLQLGGLSTNRHYVSWDKIGEALCGDKYCRVGTHNVEALDKIRSGEIK